MYTIKLCKVCLIVSIVFLLSDGGHAFVSSHNKTQKTNITGEIVVHIPKNVPFSDIAGKTLPEDNFPLYLFSWNDSMRIRNWIKKIEQDKEDFKHLDAHERAWIYEKRLDDLYLLVTTSTVSRRTKSGKNGQFAFEKLEAGEKYLVIGIELRHAYGIAWVYKIIGPLKMGENQTRLERDW